MMRPILMLWLASTAFVYAQTSWSYEGNTGPENWGGLDEAHSICDSGTTQSPINISRTIEASLPIIHFDYHSDGVELINKGYTLQMNYKEGSSMEVAGTSYNLLQLHFHTPSENTIQGKSYPIEVHFVHASAEGQLAVIGIMFRESEINNSLEQFINHFSTNVGETVLLEQSFNAYDLIPESLDYYRFIGSLTTPPCSEGVLWMVMKDPAPISSEQITALKALMPINNRPVQPLNARAVLR